MLTERVIVDGTLTATPGGFTVDVRLPWYRALPLSCLEGVDVALDGERVDRDELALELDGSTYGLAELPPLHDRSWYVTDPLRVKAPFSGLTPGGSHELDVTVSVRIPYIVEDERALVVRERCVRPQQLQPEQTR